MEKKTKTQAELDDEYNKNMQLEWIRFREDTLGVHAFEEQTENRFFRKAKENPFVPIGGLATFAALSYGLWCFRKGRAKDSQMMMRARIAAQGFTIVAIIGGFFMSSNTSSTKAIAQGTKSK